MALSMECYYADCHYAIYCYAERRYAECRGAPAVHKAFCRHRQKLSFDFTLRIGCVMFQFYFASVAGKLIIRGTPKNTWHNSFQTPQGY